MEEPVKDRLATTDEFGDRVYIYTAEVKGFFRKHRNWTQVILILFFLLLPWLKVNHEQAVLLSIPERKFAFFGWVFWAHDAPLVFFIFASTAIGLALVTAVWGRVWCGWACPQTVFIDGVFRKIETWIEGNHIQRRKLDSDPFSLQKFFKKSLKWFLFFLVSTLIAHSFIAYFVGAETLVGMISHPPSENWTDFLIVFGITAILLFDFGWFREQFCFIVCPYGRFQSVLMDQFSMAVMYDEKRGEPRRGSPAKSQPLSQLQQNDTGEFNNQSKTGDCINCKRCIMVCPTGIDIRRGIQMECIHCTACIDACDEIMEKVKKPKGLIRYSSIGQMQGKEKQIWTFRTVLYLVLIVGALSILTFKVSQRESLHMVVLRLKAAPYRILDGTESGYIMNQFKAHVRNQGHDILEVKFSIESEDNPIDDKFKNEVKLIQQSEVLKLKPGEAQSQLLFVKFPTQLTKGLGAKNIQIKAEFKTDQADQETKFISDGAKLLGPI